MRNWNCTAGLNTFTTITNCEPTYEELKLFLFLIGLFLGFLIASLPMRNWNSKCRCWRLRRSMNCEPTYEELKPGCINGWAKDLTDCEPTYEELKLFPVCFNQPAFFIASLPMRNWNRTYHHNINRPFCHCEPTYEELKHEFAFHKDSKAIWLRAYLWGIETTYSCICDRLCIWLRAYLWGIETPFWKYPLRCRQDRLRAYLWGIETRDMAQLVQATALIASLPMRNWNIQEIPSLHLLLWYCEPTYEELKLWGTAEANVTDRVIASLPMRNWNSFRISCSSGFRWNCEPTYEELKHIYLSTILPSNPIASLPMRNWNIKCPILPSESL